MLEQPLKHTGQPLVPLAPVVATRSHMEFVLEMAPAEERRKVTIRRKQSFLVAAREIQVWRPPRIGAVSENKRITVTPCLASPRSEN